MKIEKKVMGTLNKCYCVAPLHYNNEDYVLVAAEKQDPCYLFDLKGDKVDTIWEGPGGVMSMVQVPGSNGQFLSTHKFFSPNDSKEAKIIVCTPENSKWNVNTLVELPFVHRFDILTSNGKNYLIACALKSGHEYKNDWEHPGRIFVAELPDNLTDYNEENQLKLEILKEGLTKNHGYTRYEENGQISCVVSTDNGIFRITPPTESCTSWNVETLTEDAGSDAALVDLNGDGIPELCALAPFHGPDIKIYEKKTGKYEVAYRYDKPAEFTHAIYGGDFGSGKAFIVGHREGERDLLMFTFDSENKTYKYELIDHDRGPANVLRIAGENKEILVAANRETDEIAMYTITDI